MKQYIFMGIVSLFLLSACNSKNTSEQAVHASAHDGHAHDAEPHAHGSEPHAHDAEPHEHDAEPHEHGSDEITLSPRKAQAIGVKSEVIRPAAFRQVIKTGGQVLTAQGDERTVVATVAGVVAFNNKLVEGTTVGKGMPLLTLSSHNMAEGDPVARARIAFEVSQKEYERMQALVGNRIVSEKEFAQVRQAYENARITYEAIARNGAGKGGVRVTAPIGGYLKNLLVNEGDYVETGTPLLSITQNARLFLRADVSEKYYNDLRTISSANFRIPYNDKVYELKALNGRLLSYGKSAGDNSYYIPVTFEFDNRDGIVPGSFVEVFLLSAPIADVLSLPHTALTEEQGSFFVYRQVDEEGYEKQLVTLGADNGEQVQILTGIRAGDRIVTQGAYQVKLAGATAAIPAHTHEH
ncbi:MAG: efflux RND transporter periplasmic adaptor subunit [Prevotellaceae bacterium]|jgi:RND family efflux transporter MFP subunit|nr:efflux RND transporter periplasmic adaptor subunit [Prevotellaceae bacterium]